jgi:replication initiation protein RepC
MRYLTLAAVRRLPELGITQSAWAQAVETMGDVAATLAVRVIDANRDHPTTPVRRPGGLLRALTHRYRSGEVTLAGSLIGPLERAGRHGDERPIQRRSTTINAIGRHTGRSGRAPAG